MRVLAIGDGHLRSTSRRNALRLRALDQIAAAAEALRPDLIVWPGDLFDTRSSIDDRNILLGYLQRLGAVARVLVVRGNHDAPGDLDIFGAIETAHAVVVATEPDVHVMHTRGGWIAVACLPYPEEGALAAMGIAPPDVPDVAAAALDAIFMKFAGDLGAARADGAAPLFIGHANLLGAVASTGQPLVGAEIALRPEHLARLGDDVPKVLNHIHEPQELHGAVYVGSIAPADWAEVTPRRFLTLDYDGTRWTTTSHPLALPRLWHVEGVFDGTHVAWVVRKGPEGPVESTPASFAGDEVRVRYRFQARDAGRLDLARAQLLADFAEVAHLELEPVAVPDRAVRAPEVAAATTTADKLRAYCALSGVEVTDGLLAKLAALEAQDAAALLAHLEARLAAMAGAGSAVAA
jgi:exonuclease SbcD